MKEGVGRNAVLRPPDFIRLNLGRSRNSQMTSLISNCTHHPKRKTSKTYTPPHRFMRCKCHLLYWRLFKRCFREAFKNLEGNNFLILLQVRPGTKINMSTVLDWEGVEKKSNIKKTNPNHQNWLSVAFLYIRSAVTFRSDVPVPSGTKSNYWITHWEVHFYSLASKKTPTKLLLPSP